MNSMLDKLGWHLEKKSKFTMSGSQEDMFNLASGWALVVMETHLCHLVLLLSGNSQVIP